MKLHVGFYLLCGALLIGAVAALVGGRGGEPARPIAPTPAPAETPPCTPSDDPAREPVSSAARANTADFDRTAASAPAAPVRWVTRAMPAARVASRLRAAREALAGDSSNSAARRDELAALLELEDWPAALESAEALLRAEPGDAPARQARATLRMRLKLWSQALEDVDALLALLPADTPLLFNRAVALQALGRLTESRSAWDRLIAAAPAHVEGRARRAEVLMELREPRAAAEDLLFVAEALPGDAAALLNLAAALVADGRPDEARARLRAHLADSPRDVPALNRLARISWDAFCADPAGAGAARDEAASCCRRSLALDGTQTELRALLKRVEEK